MTTGKDLVVRFDDLTTKRSMVFGDVVDVLQARDTADVVDILAAVDRANARGLWAAGFVAYEAAAAFDNGLSTHPTGVPDAPLAWFALTRPPTVGPSQWADDQPSEPPPAWDELVPSADLEAAITTIRKAIARGDTYQCNLTTRLQSAVDPTVAPTLYRHMVGRQCAAFAAYLDTGAHIVASASPELFFRRQGSRILTRPMKGTARRGRTPELDTAERKRLLSSPKERAENLMIVDLLRNDLGRIAETGSVRVEHLGRAERYDTVWQLTSDVAAEVRPSVTTTEIFRALFPSGSITGAPKTRTMQLIRDLEPGPRGVYCGAIGWTAPPGAHVSASFSVAIRTAVIHRDSQRAVYGVGAGITWDSDPRRELAEMALKAEILSSPSRAPRQ